MIDRTSDGPAVAVDQFLVDAALDHMVGVTGVVVTGLNDRSRLTVAVVPKLAIGVLHHLNDFFDDRSGRGHHWHMHLLNDGYRLVHLNHLLLYDLSLLDIVVVGTDEQQMRQDGC